MTEVRVDAADESLAMSETWVTVRNGMLCYARFTQSSAGKQHTNVQLGKT